MQDENELWEEKTRLVEKAGTRGESHGIFHGRKKEGTLSTCIFKKDLQPIRMRDVC